MYEPPFINVLLLGRRKEKVDEETLFQIQMRKNYFGSEKGLQNEMFSSHFAAWSWLAENKGIETV